MTVRLEPKAPAAPLTLRHLRNAPDVDVGLCGVRADGGLVPLFTLARRYATCEDCRRINADPVRRGITAARIARQWANLGRKRTIHT